MPGKETHTKSLAHKALGAIIIAYGVSVFLLWLLQWWLGEGVPGIGLVKSLLHLLLFPSLLLFPLCLLVGRIRLAVIVLPGVVAFFISFGGLLLPRTQAAPTAGPTIRLMTFNIQSPDDAATESLVSVIRAANADIVALQELTPPAATAFGQRLRDVYPHQALHPHPDHSGQGVLSRYPITADEFWRHDEWPGALGRQRAELQIAGRSVILYNVHLVPPLSFKDLLKPAPHQASIANLIDRMAGETGAVLLTGDFNLTDQFHGYRELVDRYTDAYRAVGAVGFGFTFPHKEDWPVPALLRLDYVFYDGVFRGIHAQVWPDTGTADHAPVIADLAFATGSDEDPR